ncbi:MAG: GNAT family N-acetyltransferase [Acidobacteria bacterium]|nr:MAG: GNAT family N-acetyltransferase [Acidobacteriota bacterium]
MDIELKTDFRIDDELSMRAWREDDVDAALDIVMRNREHLHTFMQWMTPEYSIESAQKFITDGIASRLERKTLGLALFRGDKLIGSVGYSFDWPVRKTEIGYWIDKDEERRGIITRACRMMIDYAFDELQLNRVEIRCSTENRRSAAVPERLGFRKEGVIRQSEILNGKLHDFNIYGLLAEDPRLW